MDKYFTWYNWDATSSPILGPRLSLFTYRLVLLLKVFPNLSGRVWPADTATLLSVGSAPAGTSIHRTNRDILKHLAPKIIIVIIIVFINFRLLLPLSLSLIHTVVIITIIIITAIIIFIVIFKANTKLSQTPPLLFLLLLSPYRYRLSYEIISCITQPISYLEFIFE